MNTLTITNFKYQVIGKTIFRQSNYMIYFIITTLLLKYKFYTYHFTSFQVYNPIIEEGSERSLGNLEEGVCPEFPSPASIQLTAQHFQRYCFVRTFFIESCAAITSLFQVGKAPITKNLRFSSLQHLIDRLLKYLLSR